MEADMDKLRKKAAALPMPDDVKETFERECSKLGRIAPQSPDYSVLLSYLELLTDLPWGKEDTLNQDIKQAEDTLEAEHYGLEKVKERILEQIALLINAPGGHAPILCLVGAPGVGKTSLGQSIARALGRKYKRVALGGLHDEAEIRGHRRTYIGAMPGRIIDALRRCGASNPVLLLDEIDKIGSDFKVIPRQPCSKFLIRNRTAVSTTITWMSTSTCRKCSSSLLQTPCHPYPLPCSTAWRS